MKRFKKAYLEITNVCNMNCSFCHGTSREKEFMAEDKFTLALDRLRPFTDYLYFHLMGEPLCHPRIKEYVNMANDKGYKVSVTTNGTLLDESLTDLPLYKVAVSLHSFEKGERDEQEKYLQKVCGFARSASKKGVLVSLRLWNKGSGVDNTLTEEYLKREFQEPWREGRAGSFTLERGVYLEYANRFSWPDMKEREERENKFCYGLRDQIGVLVDGSVVPCCLDAEGDITLGNIFETSLNEIISSERALTILKGFGERKATEQLCRKCKYADRF
ncbi:MAG: SPASM domain-containing protein [Clostridia bacterium]|nr:SPASM domain-containing protein [Clostridia bacterium]